MLKKIYDIVSKILNFGISADMLFIESQKIYIYNILVALAIPLQIVYLLYHLLHGHYALFFINLIQIPILLIGYLSIKYPTYKYVRSIIIFICSLVIIYSAVSHNNGNEFILLPIVLIALIVYDSVWFFTFHTFLSLSAIIFIKFLQLHNGSISENLSLQNVNYIVSIVCLIIILIIFKRIYTRQHKEIVATNQNLITKANKLAKSKEELERFVYVASHDLQEPLRQITNFLQLFERKYHEA